MVFIILASVDSPTGELQYQTLSFSGLNLAYCSLGRWNRQSSLGLRCLRKFSIVLTGQRPELITLNIFPSDSSVESLTRLGGFWWKLEHFFGAHSARRLPWGVVCRTSISLVSFLYFFSFLWVRLILNEM